MQNQIVDGNDKWDRTEIRHIEVRGEKEIRTRGTNEAGQLHLLGEGVVREVCRDDLHIVAMKIGEPSLASRWNE